MPHRSLNKFFQSKYAPLAAFAILAFGGGLALKQSNDTSVDRLSQALVGICDFNNRSSAYLQYRASVLDSPTADEDLRVIQIIRPILDCEASFGGDVPTIKALTNGERDKYIKVLIHEQREPVIEDGKVVGSVSLTPLDS